jgi:hypothetical protein
LDGMRMVQRKQDSMSDAFLFSLMQKQLEEEGEIDEIKLDVVKAPRIQGDETLSNLASRIVDEVKVVKTPKSLANRVLQQAGIDTSLEAAQPIVSNGHLKHVGQRARKLVRRENVTRRIRKVKTTTSPSQINRKPTAVNSKRGAPNSTKSRPAIGREYEARISSRVKINKRGITSKVSKESSQAKQSRNNKLDNAINFSL